MPAIERAARTLDGFVLPGGLGAHFHPANDLLGAVVGPGYFRLPVKDPLAMPVFAQADEQSAELIDWLEILVGSLARIRLTYWCAMET